MIRVNLGPTTNPTDRPADENRIEDRGRISNLVNEGDGLAVTWGDGHESRYRAVWLRDNCSCPMCRDPRNGQRLFDIATLADRITVTEATGGGAGELRLTFAPDGHRGRLDTGWLRSHCYSEVSGRERQFGPRPWGKELMFNFLL